MLNLARSYQKIAASQGGCWRFQGRFQAILAGDEGDYCSGKCLYSVVCAEGGIDGVVQAENLSVETGCWLYVVGQHTTATTPFVHYVSPRFREDATKEVNIIHNNFLRTISALISSRRRTVTDVTMELDSTRARLVEIEREAKRQQALLTEQRAQLARQATELARYRGGRR